MKFLAGTFGGVVPEYGGDNTEQDARFYGQLYERFEEFLGLLEEVRIKEALRACMTTSSLCNAYMQEQKPWDLAKAGP